MDRKIDAKLVSDYRLGDTSALAILVKRWHKPFCNKAYYIVRDADLAKDIAQDCWAIIINKIDSLKDHQSFGSWALRIVYSTSLDELRKSTRKRTKQEAYAKDIENDLIVEVEEDSSRLKKRVIESVKQLPEQQQTVIRLFYVEDYSLKDISDILNIRIGTAKSRLFHAREKLKKSLKTKNHEK